MKRASHLIVTWLATVPLSGCTQQARSPSPSDAHGSAEAELEQMELDWEKALVSHDATVLARIIADDWVETSWDGTSFGKARAIADLPASTPQSVIMDPVKVRVFGDLAIVTTGDTEKSTDVADDGTAHYVWTDVYLKRAGRWQVISTQGSKLPHAQARTESRSGS